MAYEARTIGGIIKADGTIRKGTGFTVTHQNTGVYIVNFDKPFDSVAYGFFVVDVQPDINESSSNTNNIRTESLTNGPTAWVISENVTTMKYFTLNVNLDDLTMKDYAVSFSVTGYDFVPNETPNKPPEPYIPPIGRTITGVIDANGKKIKGKEFTVTHSSTGSYTIKFNSPFRNIAPDLFTATIPEITEQEAANSKVYNAADPIINYGPNALVKEKSENGMKYFTFVMESDGLHMKDYKVDFSATGDIW